MGFILYKLNIAWELGSILGLLGATVLLCFTKIIYIKSTTVIVIVVDHQDMLIHPHGCQQCPVMFCNVWPCFRLKRSGPVDSCVRIACPCRGG